MEETSLCARKANIHAPGKKDEENIQNQSIEVLKNAPDQLEDYFVVPKVIE